MEHPEHKINKISSSLPSFKDEITIHVKGGNGGRGCVSFHHEKYQAKGGPDGGDGGKGGDVIIQTSPHLNSLYHLTHLPKYKAQDGAPGRGNNCSGKKGRSLILEVPLGTIIRSRYIGIPFAGDNTYRNVLKDLKEVGESIVAAKGGRSGRGNYHFANPTHQTPDYAEPGELGEERYLYLELKLIADVGLVGLPNAGKSLLLRRVSAARPKVANYPFTTLEPSLGIIKGSEYQTIVVADLPGLIEGAHLGRGLGDKFLKHVERTGLIAHIIDFSVDGSPLEAYKTIRNELSSYSHILYKKPEIIVANKMDLPKAEENYSKYAKKFKVKPIPISALNKTGLENFVRLLFKKLLPRYPSDGIP